jgi:hypothetical protein
VKTRFVVSVTPGTPEQNESFKNYLNNIGVGWWFWITGTWLVVDLKGKATATSLRDAVTQIFPTLNTMVIEIREGSSITWAGYGPKTKQQDMFKWMRETWGGET